MTPHSLDTIAEMTRSIKEDILPEIKDEIKELKEYQKTMNGKVAAHESYIISQKSSRKTLTRFGAGIIAVLGVVVTLFSGFFSHKP